MNDNNLELRAREVFLTACDDLDAATAVRLRAARAAALGAPARRHTPRLLLPVGACAAALLVVALWQWPVRQVATTPATLVTTPAATTAADAPVTDADVDLYDNLDFYTWLASQPVVAGGGR